MAKGKQVGVRGCDAAAVDRGDVAFGASGAVRDGSNDTVYSVVNTALATAQFNADREWDHLAVLALIKAVRALNVRR